MASKDKIEIVKNFLAAISENRPEDCAQYLHDDVVCEVPFPIQSTPSVQRGKQVFLNGLYYMNKFYESFILTISDIYPVLGDEVIIAEWDSNGTVAKSGTKFRNTYIGVVKFKDGLIILWREYFNPELTNELFKTDGFSIAGD